MSEYGQRRQSDRRVALAVLYKPNLNTAIDPKAAYSAWKSHDLRFDGVSTWASPRRASTVGLSAQ